MAKEIINPKLKRVFSFDRHPQIAHLTDEQLNCLINDYYAGIKINVIFQKYNIEAKGNNLINFLPTVITESYCIYCKQRMVKRLESKKLIKYSFWRNKSYCIKCGHIDESHCKCVNCQQKSLPEESLDLQRDVKRSHNELCLNQYEPIRIVDLSIIDKVYLGSIISVCQTENLQFVYATNSKGHPFAPTQDMFNEIIFTLTEKKIIITHPNSTSGKISDNYNLSFSKMDHEKLLYHVNVENFYSKNILDLLLFPKITKEDCDDLLKLWRKISIEECKAYLQFSLNYVDFPYFVGEKSQLIFEKLLEDFSVSQIFGLINRTLGYTSIEFQAGKLTRSSTAGYLLWACQKQAEKAIINNWKLSNYYRYKDTPESVLSSFFFDRVLKLRENGLLIKPSISSIEYQ